MDNYIKANALLLKDVKSQLDRLNIMEEDIPLAVEILPSAKNEEIETFRAGDMMLVMSRRTEQLMLYY